MFAIYTEATDLLAPKMPYDDILALSSKRTEFEYPEPTVIFVPLTHYSTPVQPRNARRLPRGVQRPNFISAFEMYADYHETLAKFRPYEDPDQSHPVDYSVLAGEAQQYGQILLAFHSCPTADQSVRELCLVVRHYDDLGCLPVLFNAKPPAGKIPADSFIPRVQLCRAGKRSGLIVRSPGDYYCA